MKIYLWYYSGDLRWSSRSKGKFQGQIGFRHSMLQIGARIINCLGVTLTG